MHKIPEYKINCQEYRFHSPINTRGWKVAERSGMKYMGNVLRKDTNLKKKSMFFLIDKNDYSNQFQI